MKKSNEGEVKKSTIYCRSIMLSMFHLLATGVSQCTIVSPSVCEKSNEFIAPNFNPRFHRERKKNRNRTVKILQDPDYDGTTPTFAIIFLFYPSSLRSKQQVLSMDIDSIQRWFNLIYSGVGRVVSTSSNTRHC